MVRCAKSWRGSVDEEAADLGRIGVSGGVREVSGWWSRDRKIPVVEPGREKDSGGFR